MKEEKVIEKKKNKLPIIIGGILVVVIATIIFVVINATGSKDKKVKEKLELAAQYLANMDYEKAIATYEEAIKIDPKSADAYCGLADTYVAMADNAVKEGDIDKANEYYDAAIKALDDGIDCVSDSNKEKLEKYKAKIKTIKNKVSGLTETTANSVQEENTKDETIIRNDSDMSQAEIGDVVNFGQYLGEPCQWDVLDKDENRVLLVSHYILTWYPYDQSEKAFASFDELEDTNWEQSEVRYWLNNELIYELFNEDELKAIPTVTINNPSIENYIIKYLPEEQEWFNDNSNPCGETEDRLFLLSLEEIERYYGPITVGERDGHNFMYVNTSILRDIHPKSEYYTEFGFETGRSCFLSRSIGTFGNSVIEIWDNCEVDESCCFGVYRKANKKVFGYAICPSLYVKY